jgi:hypothetical protein
VTPSSRRSWLARQALGGLALRARGPLVGFPADPWGYPVRWWARRSDDGWDDGGRCGETSGTLCRPLEGAPIVVEFGKGLTGGRVGRVWGGV